MKENKNNSDFALTNNSQIARLAYVIFIEIFYEVNFK